MEQSGSFDEAAKGRVVILGGSGFLGRGLARWLGRRGRDVVAVSRSRPDGLAGVWWEAWDGRTAGAWTGQLEGAAAVVNVVGRSVDCRKTPEQRDEILRSRLDSVRAIGHALRRCDRPPPVWVQAGSTHIYGDPAEACCDERAWPGEGLAPFVCTRWEAAYEAALPERVRGVVLRMSFVLGRGGGALARLTRLARWGLGGRIGSGRQWMSWIHQEDVNRLFTWAIDRPDMRGVYNATSPRPVRNDRFMRELRRAVRRPWSPAVPEAMVRIGSRWMRTDPELALCGRRCVPARLSEMDFEFRYADVRSALDDLCGKEQGHEQVSDVWA